MYLDNSRLLPLELFSDFKSSFDFAKFCTFESQVSILEPTLQAGNKIPHWQPQSKLGIYLGKSPEYTGNVLLVYNSITNFVSLQFYLVHDSNFASVMCKRVNILPLDSNILLKTLNKVPEDELINVPLEVTMYSERNKNLKV